MKESDIAKIKIGTVRLGITSDNLEHYDFTQDVELHSLGDLLDINILVSSKIKIGYYSSEGNIKVFRFNEDARDILQLIHF